MAADGSGEGKATLGLSFRTGEGLWRGRLGGTGVSVAVAGTREGPDRTSLAAARAVLERLDDLAAALSAHLAADEVVVVQDDGEPRTVRHPAPPPIDVEAVDATTAGSPQVVVMFATGYPDSGHVYCAVVEGPAVDAVTGRLR